LTEDFENFKRQITLKCQETAAKEIHALDQKVRAIGSDRRTMNHRNPHSSSGTLTEGGGSKMDPDQIEEIL